MEGIKSEYMEALRRSNDIEEIRQLMDQLRIIEEENKQIERVEKIETKEENEEVILNYSSSEIGSEFGVESDYDEIFMEKGETSNSKQKRKREEYWNPHSSWEKYEDETMNRKGYTRASGKWTKVSEEFKPHYEESKSRKLLNLDCVRNPEEILERWSNDMIMFIATDERFSKINLMDVKNLIAYKTTGNVLKYLTSIDDAINKAIYTGRGHRRKILGYVV
jgi:hypothetical protein